MATIVYLMKNNNNRQITKFGHRTKSSYLYEEVIYEVNQEYDGFTCFATYNLGDHTREDTELLVKQIRIIINMISGKLENEQPEYYNVSPDKILLVLKAISILCRNPEDLIEM